MKRRDFVRAGMAGGLLAIAGGAGVFYFSRDPKTVLRNANFKYIVSFNGQPMLVDPISRQTILVEDKIQSHSFEADPNQPGRFMGIPKNSHRIGLFDFTSRKKTGEIRAGDGLRFYGHGAWTADLEHFFTSVFSEKTNDGYIAVLRKGDFKEVARHRVSRGFTHDIRWMPDQKTLAIACSGARLIFDEDHKVISSQRLESGKIIFFDTQKSQVVHEVPFPNPKELLGHMRIARSGRVHVISSVFAPTGQASEGERGLYETSMNDDVCTPWDVPAQIMQTAIGEFLSIELSEESNVLAITLPSNHLILYFDYKEKKFISTVATNSGGLALDNGQFHYLVEKAQEADPRGRPFIFPQDRKTAGHFLAVPGILI